MENGERTTEERNGRYLVAYSDERLCRKSKVRREHAESNMSVFFDFA